MQKQAKNPEAGKDTVESHVQTAYANILAKGMYIGLVCLFVTFAIYVFRIVDPYVALDRLSGFWSMNVHDYLQETGCPDGWAWLSMLGHGDFLNFIGIAILAGLTIICYAVIIPILLKRGDKIYATLAILEVLILAFAASGLISAGH